MSQPHHIPALTRTFASIPPRCDREAFQARVLTQEDAKEARKLQALARAQRPTEGDKRRRMTGAEAASLAGAA